MKFEPKTDAELRAANLLPEGVYPFQISQAEDYVSKAGNEAIKMTVRVFKDDGSFIMITDYLMASMSFKLNHACKACGLMAEYESGALQAEDFVGKEGMVKVSIRKSEEYGDQNSVKDYVVPKDGEVKKALPKDNLAKVLDDDLNDSIPF